MNAMLDRLDAAGERQARFVSDASHELRSPLTVLRALLEIGLARPHRTDWPRRADVALTEVGRLDGLVRDLLTLGRAAGGDDAGWGWFDLSELVVGEVGRCSGSVGVDLVIAAVPGVWARGDPGQVARAVGNLLANAVRHAVSKVTVRVVSTGAAGVLEVTDDGVGVPLAERDRIFERFVRLDAARATDDGGSGLGLAIVRSIVSAHHGTVAVTAGPPGATFRVVLPAVAASARTIRHASVAVNGARTSSGRAGSRAIRS